MRLRPLVALLVAAFAAPTAFAANGPLISQVYGGGGRTGAVYKNDFVEIRNAGASAVDMSTWSLQYSSAAGTSWGSQKVALTGTLQPGQYLLVKLGSGVSASTAVGVDLPTADVTAGFDMSGSAGKLALVNSTTSLPAATCPSDASIKDLIGYGTTANCTEISPAPAPTNNGFALLRADAGCTDNGNNSTDFANGVPTPRNSSSAYAVCTAAAPGPAPAPTPAPAPGAFKQIYEIQGSGATSALAGSTVTTEGVVTRLTNTGFYMQAAVGDGNPATSDGIFVFTSTAPTVALNQLVRVAGTVTEFSTGGSTVTQIGSVSGITLVNPGQSVTPTAISLPVTGGLERYEGMLVTLAGPLTVGQNAFQARYGQLTLSAGGRLETPTNKYRPGSDAAKALAADNAARLIVLEDGNTLQNVNPTPFTGPTGALRGGDTLGAITGVIDFGPTTTSTGAPGAYRIVPLANDALQYALTNPRTTTPPAVGGNVKLASFNVLNYFTTFKDGKTADGGTASSQPCAGECRGADNLTEFNRQQAKIVAALSAIDADAVGLMEIQNNAIAPANLVAALNAKVGAGTYAVVAGAAAGVVGSDAIKNMIIYKPAKLTPAGSSVIDTDPVNNRPTVAQSFTLANGQKFTLVVNHLKSKGCSGATGLDLDQSDGQSCYTATRVKQADRLRSFVASLQTSSGSNDVVLVGDFNAYGMEDPITRLTDNGFIDQIGRFNTLGYSYTFDGAAGRLDHAITTSSLSPKVSMATEWHINADESVAHDYNQEFKQPACATCAPDPYAATPFRSSDHDPVVMGLNLYNSYITAASTTVAGTAGDDLITVGALRPTLTGGAGRDQFAFSASFAGGATITDFTPGTDLINLRAVMSAAGITAANPQATGQVTCLRSGVSDALISMDADTTGPLPRRPLLLLKNVSCASLSASSFQF
ncbi:ExeM/NucH family extracellular endonuclease [Pelomonas sp. UHG3]|uniref:ExeM/NucH family extracellular endonuclease n=1 Tax=Roseateles hydrophilus TaxID=2975054 RepID=A0ACC6CAN2_9BURK|nr:ExeM/NucH family extracellular endonuclease [Pelomonas sp. UHG3]MCY4745507.1 ExeM/NucH family extracellular endonuclease [Pelomonas sp. UHG3]